MTLDLALLTPDAVAAALAAPADERAAFIEAAAEAGHAEAQLVWGQMLLDGAVRAPDAAAAFRWFGRAAAQRHLIALNMVGRCHDQGWGTPIDKAAAARCFRAAAGRGLPWAMYNYGTALALGEGVPEDKAAALAWFKRAVAVGDGLARAKAINFVGSFAEDGWAGPRDMATAADCYRQAAAGGDFRGCFNHARTLGQAGQYGAAAEWIGKAARLGHERFRKQLRAWLEQAPEPLSSRGLAAC